MVTANTAPATGGGPAVIFQSGDMGEGSPAIAWLAGDVNGDGHDEIIQLWNNDGQLGMIVYGWSSNNTLIVLWSSSNVGQGSPALSWQIGDVNGDKQAEIIQLWDNDGQLGMIVYGWSTDTREMTTLFATGNIGQGSPALAWLIGDVNGDGRAEVVQLWNHLSNNSYNLAIIVYGWSGTGMTTVHSNGNMGPTGGATAQTYLIGDVNGDGQAEIVQTWMSKDATLNIGIYGLTTNGLTTLYSGNVGGYVFSDLTWLIGDVDGNGKAEIMYLYDNYSSVNMKIFQFANGALSTLGPYVGGIALAESWLVGDIDGDGRAEISQQWNNEGQLGMVIYDWDTGSGTMTVKWSSNNVGQGSGAEGWLIGDVTGNGRADMIQEWSNGGKLGTIIYGY